MKKAILIIVFGLLLSGNAYAKTFKIGLTFEEYYKSCKKYQRFNLINKKNLPSVVGQQGNYKVYNCITPDSVQYGSQGDESVPKNFKPIRSYKFCTIFYL